jgi:hypothetical protein
MTPAPSPNRTAARLKRDGPFERWSRECFRRRAGRSIVDDEVVVHGRRSFNVGQRHQVPASTRSVVRARRTEGLACDRAVASRRDRSCARSAGLTTPRRLRRWPSITTGDRTGVGWQELSDLHAERASQLGRLDAREVVTVASTRRHHVNDTALSDGLRTGGIPLDDIPNAAAIGRRAPSRVSRRGPARRRRSQIRRRGSHR